MPEQTGGHIILNHLFYADHIVLKIALSQTDSPEVCGFIFSTNQIAIFML